MKIFFFALSRQENLSNHARVHFLLFFTFLRKYVFFVYSLVALFGSLANIIKSASYKYYIIYI